MQNFTQIQTTQSIQSSLSLLLNNDRTALSNSSGTAFPTVSIEVGMCCYRTDLKKLYVLTKIVPEPVWAQALDLSATVELGDDQVAQAGQLSYGVLARRLAGDDGGYILLEKPESGSSLGDNVAFKLKGDNLQIVDAGTGKGFRVDLTKGGDAASATIWHSNNQGADSGLDADKLDGKQSGNAENQIPINNGTLNAKLNAELLSGKALAYFAPLSSPQFTGAPTGPTASTTSNGAQLANTEFVVRALNTIDLGSRVAKIGDTMTGALINTSGQIRVYGQGGNTNAGLIYLNASLDRFLYYDGGKYNLPGAELYVNGGLAWHSGNLTFAGGPLGNRYIGSGNVASFVGTEVLKSGTTIYARGVYSLSNCNCACDCNCTCFPAGSMVLMADGTQKEISTIVAGDMVMGPTGPWEVDFLEVVKLGPRKMLATKNRALTWTQEHLIWARQHGKQWWWSGNPKYFKFEVSMGAIKGLFDNDSVMGGRDQELAHLTKIWDDADIIDVTSEYSEDTYVYEPIAKGGDRMGFVDGYLVTCGTNQWEFDYSQFRWDEEVAREVQKKVKQ